MTIIGILMIIFGLWKINNINRDLIILKRFMNYGSQTIKIRITGRTATKRIFSSVYQVDKELQNFLICSFQIEGVDCIGYLPEETKYKINEEYFIRGLYSPESKLFFADNATSYCLIKRKFSVPYLYPPILIYPANHTKSTT